VWNIPGSVVIGSRRLSQASGCRSFFFSPSILGNDSVLYHSLPFGKDEECRNVAHDTRRSRLSMNNSLLACWDGNKVPALRGADVCPRWQTISADSWLRGSERDDDPTVRSLD
jgi:hypothetical protein